MEEKQPVTSESPRPRRAWKVQLSESDWGGKFRTYTVFIVVAERDTEMLVRISEAIGLSDKQVEAISYQGEVRERAEQFATGNPE